MNQQSSSTARSALATWFPRIGAMLLGGMVGAALGVLWLVAIAVFLFGQAQNASSSIATGSFGSDSSSGGGRADHDWWKFALVVVLTILAVVVGFWLGEIQGVLFAGATVGGVIGVPVGLGIQFTREKRAARLAQWKLPEPSEQRS